MNICIISYIFIIEIHNCPKCVISSAVIVRGKLDKQIDAIQTVIIFAEVICTCYRNLILAEIECSSVGGKALSVWFYW